MKRLRIAIQKSGRLNEDSLAMLKECGISIDNGKNQLKAVARNFPVELLYLRNSDIPQYIEDGVADIGIIGENVVVEKEKKVTIVEKLGFARCRLSLAVAKEVDYTGLDYFEGKKLATSYPNTLKAFLIEKNINAEIHQISGSVEIAPGIGLADGICDLVSSGNTLFTNGLKEVEQVSVSEAALVRGENLSEEALEILDKLVFRLKAVMRSRDNKYVLLNAPNDKIDEILEILPGMKSPTVLPLAEQGWSSIHSVINENDFWEIIDKLRDRGAQGILVIPIEKMVL